MENLKRFHESMNRFTEIDGDNFGACLAQCYVKELNRVLEYRSRKSDNSICIIEIYHSNKGYSIFAPES
jgi:hypothetical protein